MTQPTVLPEHYVFVGAPRPVTPIDCVLFDTPQAPHRRAPRHDHDHSDYPERYNAYIDILEALQGPPIPSSARRTRLGEDPPPPQSVVAFALGTRAFTSRPQHAPHDTFTPAYCAHINASLASPYVVIHAYRIHVDRGNSRADPFQETWGSLGTDPTLGSQGFETLEDARTYAQALVSGVPNP